MRVSWVHLNDLLLSRDQATDVAVIGPLAIDLLAIMATALILSGRVRANVQDINPTQAPSRPNVLDIAAHVPSGPSDTVQATTTVADEASTWLQTLAASALDTSTTPAYPVTSVPVIGPDAVPAAAKRLIQRWATADRADRPTATEVDALLAGEFGKTTRTTRRWRLALGAKG